MADPGFPRGRGGNCRGVDVKLLLPPANEVIFSQARASEYRPCDGMVVTVGDPEILNSAGHLIYLVAKMDIFFLR